MADTDVFGLLSLLLAAAGAVYLVWARVLRPGSDKAELHPIAPRDRAADTMPPVLRPEAELSPKMLAKREALRQSSRPPPPDTDLMTSDVVVRSGGVSEPPKAESEAPRSQPAAVHVEAPKSQPPASAKAAAPASANVPASAKAASPASANVAASPASAKAAAPASAKAAAPASAKAAAPASAKAAAPASAKAAPGTSAKEAKRAGAQAAAPAAKPKARKDDPFDDVPQIGAEEDDDVEPTRIGRLVKDDAIQPIVEKIVFDDGAGKAPEGSAASLLVVYALSQTDTGKRRKQNEDSFLVLEGESVYVVADGMGGHRGGQYASKLAVKTVGGAFEAKSFDAPPHADIPLEASELARAMQMANAAIFHEAKMRPELTGMGTTLCAARFTRDMRRLYLGHVGDSRCYRLRDGVMKQMTNDHTMADYGVAGPEGAHLSRALGVWPTVPIDMVMAEPKLGDVYLLCSDGLTKMVPDTTIATQLLHEEDPKAAVERLVFFANAAGGKDNITIILLRVVEAD